MIKDRIRNQELFSMIMTPFDAARLIHDGDTVATSGFTPSGYPKAVPLALAERVKSGEKIEITLITGASVGPELDGILSEVGCIRRRYPYQTNDSMRKAINGGGIAYADMHLSHVPQFISWMPSGDSVHLSEGIE